MEFRFPNHSAFHRWSVASTVSRSRAQKAPHGLDRSAGAPRASLRGLELSTTASTGIPIPHSLCLPPPVDCFDRVALSRPKRPRVPRLRGLDRSTLASPASAAFTGAPPSRPQLP